MQSRVVAQCFVVRRHLRVVRLLSPNSSSTRMTVRVVVALVLSRLDYAYCTMGGRQNISNRRSVLRLVRSKNSGDSTIGSAVVGVAASVMHPRAYSIRSQLVVDRVPHGKAPEYFEPFARCLCSIVAEICIIQSASRPASSSLDCWCKVISGVRASSLE